jgi:hypothetical protein
MLVLTMMPIAMASSSTKIQSPTIIDMQSSTQIPSGSQIYLYGGVTGGASYIRNFAYISTITNTSSNSPPWAFNGSYADYNILVTYGGHSESIPFDFNISQVNYQKQTFTVNVYVGGAYSSLSGSYSASFNKPSPFPAVSPSDLSILKTGKAPPDISGAQITIGVNIIVPAGSFNTIEINNTGEVIYVDASTGLIVKVTGDVFFGKFSTIELVKTNIQNNPTLSFIWVVLAVVIIIPIAVIVLFFRILGKGPKNRVV